VGGIEEVSHILADEFVAAGHAVTVVTQTSTTDHATFPFEVVRRPGPARLLQLAGWCEVCLHNHISLRTAWPLALRRRPWVVAHHTWIARIDGRMGWRDRLKHFVICGARNIAISSAISAELSVPATIIGNPYRDTLFRRDPSAVRDRELVFLGRLVSDKGLDLLFEALGLLRRRGLSPRLTVIGIGPEERKLRALAAELGLEDTVSFAGKITGSELAAVLNRHRIVVAPSRWQEPFGLAPLEGTACGCVAIVARCGGLPEAIGPCGVTFQHEDVADLARRIEELLDPATDLAAYRDLAPGHLREHGAAAVAAKYLRVLEEARR
jgi:glycosyltransferase involved in cell wall biosynthesis